MVCSICGEDKPIKKCSNEPFSCKKTNCCRDCGLKYGYKEWLWERET